MNFTNQNGIKWLREEDLLLNEIFDYTSNYTEIDKSEFLEYKKKILKHVDPEFKNKEPNLEFLELQHKREHDPRVHYYIYKDFLIFYGKFKRSNKYEVHFWNIKDLSFESLGSANNYSAIFSVVMSILQDKHFSKRLDNIHISHRDISKLDFYKKLFKKC